MAVPETECRVQMLALRRFLLGFLGSLTPSLQSLSNFGGHSSRGPRIACAARFEALDLVLSQTCGFIYAGRAGGSHAKASWRGKHEARAQPADNIRRTNNSKLGRKPEVPELAAIDLRPENKIPLFARIQAGPWPGFLIFDSWKYSFTLLEKISPAVPLPSSILPKLTWKPNSCPTKVPVLYK